jgi:hypothetical protein
LKAMITSTKAWSVLWVVAEFGGSLNASPASFASHPCCVACATLVNIKNFTFRKNREWKYGKIHTT